MSLLNLNIRSGQGTELVNIRNRGLTQISQLKQVNANLKTIADTIQTDLTNSGGIYETSDLMDCVTVRNEILKDSLLAIADAIPDFEFLTNDDRDAILAIRAKVV